MSERSLRGMSIGTKSLETDSNVAFVDRKQIKYRCPNGHVFAVAMVVNAEVPVAWQCRCGQEGELLEGEGVDERKPVKPVRTHWDMLMERRSIEELEVLLEERLDLLRTGRLRRGRH
ncbi:RNA polymerase-binding protein RbpA [Actinotignum urinale]|uniref:RNA polymerase-binding protein RbpA n=1 Tax=Actinotignum urinale TaxID=190146 RepID=A0AAW9HKT8_9ACTO|nr:RNA polymerase-binding protein RbpA [Actinotignum urinale]MDY5128842.1 RNA polymerase-binding protein RbpA [Actinotignum urinale]MDY5133056.1 RNA polymerase-binding protein RbpA [Actinotignum urinale]MDY5152115.1 RNA polymerase-binding protein RbpA [Actinotignum urinale]MDY5154533.1 RNA polymerase-binding protein RbpA [Actinotignum urinale]MDY5160267.1 RNA polymerase-binding protein RbpA [Actinotignum urinale]